MNSKLTLSCKKENIRFAKRYARRRRTSVSALFDRYIEILRNREKNPLPEDEFVKRFAGIVDSGSSDTLKDLFNSAKEKRERFLLIPIFS